MLVLSRKRDEQVNIRIRVEKLRLMLAEAEQDGCDTVELASVKVVAIKGNLTRLGFVAPLYVDLVREELKTESEDTCPIE